jgi:hypothetical protein
LIDDDADDCLFFSLALAVVSDNYFLNSIPGVDNLFEAVIRMKSGYVASVEIKPEITG